MQRRIPAVLLFTALILAATAAPAHASDVVRVYLGGDASTVRPALELAGDGAFVVVEDLSHADVFFLNGAIPAEVLFGARRNPAAGLVLILGPEVTAQDFTAVTGVPVEFSASDDAISPIDIAEIKDPISLQIIWNGAPQIRARFTVLTPLSSVQPLVTGYETGDWLIWSLPDRKSFVVNFFLGAGENSAFREWVYYNYLIYHLTMRAAGREPAEFADYPGAPVPNAADQTALLLLAALLVFTAVAVFALVRRRSLWHP